MCLKKSLSAQNYFKSNGNIAKIAVVLTDHRNARCKLIKELVLTPKTLIKRIIANVIKKRNLCRRFVPHAVTDEQRQQISEASDYRGD